jgi:hypothetical protein
MYDTIRKIPYKFIGAHTAHCHGEGNAIFEKVEVEVLQKLIAIYMKSCYLEDS